MKIHHPATAIPSRTLLLSGSLLAILAALGLAALLLR
jgi:hypothetical protein